MKIKKEIRKARELLRNIHQKYQTELFDITLKIDKYLETIETQEEKEEE